MPHNHRISVITVPDKHTDGDRNNFSYTTGEAVKKKPADFETAIATAGYGKFQYLLLLAIIPVSWSNSIDTASVAIILPSAECDLQMTLFQKGVLNAIIFVGMVSSGYLWGYVADVRGRKIVFMYGYLADGICNILCGLSQNFWTLAFFKFLSGFIISGPHASILAYCSEFYGVKERVRIPLVIGFSITFGNTVAAALAWLVIPQTWSIVLGDGVFVYNSWRLYLSLCGVPSLIGLICLSQFPESPKFLMSQGRREEALEVFKKIYKVNSGKSADEFPIQLLEDETCKKSATNEEQDGKLKKRVIFFYPYLLRLLSVTTMQFGSMWVTNTLRMWQPQLFAMLADFDSLDHNTTMGKQHTFCEILDLSSVGNENSITTADGADCSVVNETVYMNTAISSLFGCACLLVASIMLNILNHKILLYICYGVSFCCIVCLYWSTDALLTLILTGMTVGFTNTTLSTIIGATVILFPTSLRAIAVSLAMMIGRIGTIVGNLLFPVLLSYGCLVPMIQLALFTLLCIVLTWLLPLYKEKSKK
ncbi:putative transporter SVOPL [Osmia lignaria lignaria]|uniref:putative transporter SVOPL n=1 Tax=Osmia lignaria lignaria TaxID=1437193 RepID=UPI00402B65ED